MENWREAAHRTIDEYCLRKTRDFDGLIDDERKKQQRDLDQMRVYVNELIENKPTNERIISINASLRSLQHQISRLEFPPNLPPLIIDESAIDIYQNTQSSSLLPLPPHHKTLQIPGCSLIAASDRHLLLENLKRFFLLDSQLGICNEIPWTDETAWELLWSKTCARFIIIITSKKIFTLDEATLNIQQCPIVHNGRQGDWYCGECFKDSLFVGVNAMGSSIYQYKLGSSFDFVKEHRSPFTCAKDELIFDISSSNDNLSLTITNREDEWRVDVCSPTTFGRYWSIKLGVINLEIGVHVCSLNSGEIMINNGDHQELVHVNENGKVINKERLIKKAIRAVQLGNDSIAIVTETDVRLFH